MLFLCIEISTTKPEIIMHAMPLNLSTSLTAFRCHLTHVEFGKRVGLTEAVCVLSKL